MSSKGRLRAHLSAAGATEMVHLTPPTAPLQHMAQPPRGPSRQRLHRDSTSKEQVLSVCPPIVGLHCCLLLLSVVPKEVTQLVRGVCRGLAEGWCGLVAVGESKLQLSHQKATNPSSLFTHLQHT